MFKKIQIDEPVQVLPNVSRRALFQGGLSSGAALLALGGVGGSQAAFAADESVGLPAHPKWKFVFVNHVTTNPFFVPTQYGIADACAVFGCTWQWTGSQTSVASEMVNAMNAAIAEKVDGIAVSLVDLHAFNAPVKQALEAGHPGLLLQCGRQGQRSPRLYRPGPLRLRPGARAAHCRVWSARARSSASSPRQGNSTSSRASMARKAAIKASGKKIDAERSRNRSDGQRGGVARSIPTTSGTRT